MPPEKEAHITTVGRILLSTIGQQIAALYMEIVVKEMAEGIGSYCRYTVEWIQRQALCTHAQVLCNDQYHLCRLNPPKASKSSPSKLGTKVETLQKSFGEIDINTAQEMDEMDRHRYESYD